MAYKIRYDSAKQEKRSRYRGRLMLLTLGFFVLFAFTVWHFAPAELTALRQILFPQDQVSALLEDIRDGEPIAEAVSAFCQGILNGN